MIVEILLGLAIIYSIFASYLIIISLRRINQYENFIIQFQQIVEYATKKMKLVDASGHYKADDETGFFFQQLKELQIVLDDIFEIEKEINDKEKK
jgi:hypothetical protein